MCSSISSGNILIQLAFLSAGFSTRSLRITLLFLPRFAVGKFSHSFEHLFLRYLDFSQHDSPLVLSFMIFDLQTHSSFELFDVIIDLPSIYKKKLAIFNYFQNIVYIVMGWQCRTTVATSPFRESFTRT